MLANDQTNFFGIHLQGKYSRQFALPVQYRYVPVLAGGRVNILSAR